MPFGEAEARSSECSMWLGQAAGRGENNANYTGHDHKSHERATKNMPVMLATDADLRARESFLAATHRLDF